MNPRYTVYLAQPSRIPFFPFSVQVLTALRILLVPYYLTTYSLRYLRYHLLSASQEFLSERFKLTYLTLKSRR